MKNNNELIQALMVQIIWRTRTTYWNINQKSWGESCGDCVEWFLMEPMDIGGIRVTVERSDDGFDSWATFSFAGVSVTTERSSKRLYYYGVHEPVLSEQDWVNWFNSVIAELGRLDRVAF